MSLEQQIGDLISGLEQSGEKLFPYIHNNNYVKGQSNIYYSGPYWDNKEVEAAIKTLLTGKWLPSGEEVNKFERAFSKKFGFGHSVMVNSGSSANLVMIAALKKYFDWQDGDEIIVCVCGFPTTINPILQNNLKPVFVDIDYSDLNWNLEQIKSKITTKTRAVFSSPVLGNPYDYDKLLEICDQYNIELIADNCDSLGSKWEGEYLTKHAVAASCSFYPAHHISTIEGGMVSSNIKEIVDIARSFAWWGRDCYCAGSANLASCGTCGKRFDKWIDGYDQIVDHKYVFSNIGYNLKPLDFQGAVGIEQLKRFKDIHEKRRENKKDLQLEIEKIEGLRVINEPEGSETSWFGIPIVCEETSLKRRLVKHLEENKIQTRNYFAGNILMHPGYTHIEDYRNYPNGTEVIDKVFFIGCSPTFSKEMIEYIKDVFSKFET